MSSTLDINIHSLRIHSDHGVFDEESITGHEFILDLVITLSIGDDKITSLDQTIDYVEAYRIIKEIFSVKKRLLETNAMEIVEALHQKFPQALEVKISIRKSNPPIGGFHGDVGISLTKNFR